MLPLSGLLAPPLYTVLLLLGLLAPNAVHSVASFRPTGPHSLYTVWALSGLLAPILQTWLNLQCWLHPVLAFAGHLRDDSPSHPPVDAPTCHQAKQAPPQPVPPLELRLTTSDA